MTEVRKKGNYEQWVKFFLQAIYESAEDAILTIQQLLELHDKNLLKIEEKTNNKNIHHLFNYLEQNPIIEIKKTSKEIGVAYNTVSKAVHTFIELGILAENQKSGRTRIFSYERYLEIMRKDTV
jgi:Fic family protein